MKYSSSRPRAFWQLTAAAVLFSLVTQTAHGTAPGTSACSEVFVGHSADHSAEATHLDGQADRVSSWPEMLAHLDQVAGSHANAVEALKKAETVLKFSPADLAKASLRDAGSSANGLDALLDPKKSSNPLRGLGEDSRAIQLARSWPRGRLSLKDLRQLLATGRSLFGFDGSDMRKLNPRPQYELVQGSNPQLLKELQANPYLQITPRSDTSLSVSLPDVREITDRQLQLVRSVDPALADELLDFRESSSGQNTSKLTASDKLQGRFLEALANERLKTFNHNISDGPQSRLALYREAALLLKELSMIMPFSSMRSSDEVSQNLAHVLLLHLDLPPPRSYDTIQSLLSQTSADTTLQLIHSSQVTTSLVADIANRMKLGLKTSNSPFCYLSEPIQPVEIQKRKQGNPKSLGRKMLELEPEQWLAYLRTQLGADAQLRAQLLQNPVETLKASVANFRNFSATFNVEFTHEKEGTRDIGLRFVDADFLDLVFKQKNAAGALSHSSWLSLMSRWYQPELIWRGHGFRKHVVGEKEIVSMFRSPDLQLAANPVISAVWQGQKLTKVALDEIKRYNQSLLDGKVFEVSDDHHKMGQGYQASYGFSTSKSYDVARAFALGAMKVAEYGKQDQAQDLVKTRLVVGIRRATHYIEMGRLKPLNASFSYTYGRQQEVMGIGAADPDSVSVAKELNPDKSVFKTYLRSVDNPFDLLIIEGDADPSLAIPHDRILKIVNLIDGTERPAVEVHVAVATNDVASPGHITPADVVVAPPNHVAQADVVVAPPNHVTPADVVVAPPNHVTPADVVVAPPNHVTPADVVVAPPEQVAAAPDATKAAPNVQDGAATKNPDLSTEQPGKPPGVFSRIKAALKKLVRWK